MTIRVCRWMQCDHPGCLATFTQEHHRAYRESTGHRKATLYAAAVASNWVCDDAADLCPRHAEQTASDQAQPALFPVGEADPPV